MTSTRLPGKVLMEVMDRPMLDYEVGRIRRARRIDRIAIATTTNATDDPVADFAAREGLDLHRGPEADVLSRIAETAERFGGAGDLVVRFTADCPLIDPAVIDMVIERATAEDGPFDYTTNAIPRSWPIGLDLEVVRREALDIAAREATDSYDREHVTPFLYRNPDRFSLAHLPAPEPLSHHRWTLDEPADFKLISGVLEALHPSNPDFGYRDVLALLTRRPELAALNSDVAQKIRRYEDLASRALDATS